MSDEKNLKGQIKSCKKLMITTTHAKINYFWNKFKTYIGLKYV